MLLNYVAAFIIMIFGIYIMIAKKDALKIIIGMSLLNSGLNLLIISVSFRAEGGVKAYINNSNQSALFSDPIHQWFVIASIIISACMTGLALLAAVRLNKSRNNEKAEVGGIKK